MINASFSAYRTRVPVRMPEHNLTTFMRWNSFLKMHSIAADSLELLVFEDAPLNAGYTNDKRIVLFYAEVPIVEYYSDVSTRFIVDPAAARQYEDSLDVINAHTPDWFKVIFDGSAYWADVTIDGEARRYATYWQGRPKVWRRSKLGAKHRRPQTNRLPTPENPISLDTTRNWVALARIDADKWAKEDLQYLESVMIDAGTIIREADLILDPIRKLRETLMQVSAERRGQVNT